MQDFFKPQISDDNILKMSNLALAHVGDGVFELLTRLKVACDGNITSKTMHKATTDIVKASTQAKAARVIYDILTEEEEGVFRRGRNAKPKTYTKAATREEYTLSTAIEALFGYLYLKGRYDRINELYEKVLEAI